MSSELLAGLDIGSRSIGLVLAKAGQIVASEVVPTTFDATSQVARLMKDIRPGLLVATGYGRDLAGRLDLADESRSITEIKAQALGVARLFPRARAILDIGGQDTKAISLGAEGKVLKFEMNDRCAAGTGKFLEHTATAFQIDVQSFGRLALKGAKPPVISSMCTVFAETEATSLMAKGAAPEDIALGLHTAIVKRSLSMLDRMGKKLPLAFVGGVARNPCVLELLVKGVGGELGEDVLVPEEPDLTGALGAVVWAERLVADEN